MLEPGPPIGRLRRAARPLIALLFMGVAPAQDPAYTAEDLEHFEREVRPLIEERCASCHGGDAPKGGLDLSSAAAIEAAIDEIGLVERGEELPAGLFLEAVEYEDPLFAMPPEGKLEEREIEVLREWVRRGAALPEEQMAAAADGLDLEARRASHWAWQPMADPAPPAVAEADRVRDPLDAFLLARIEEAGLALAPEASRATWLRRVTFTLTGLPPTPAELEAFESDEDARAYEKVVDRLLDSPHYAERWARHWLDLVRYAETKAHEFDYRIPNAWQYRDYVVRAFDADVPYDRFLREHLAGDLLSEAPEHGPRLDRNGTFDESPLGTAWWWLHEDVHSPVDTRADEADRLANQVDTLTKSVLGLTVACARCHDHKFDAISSEDYHALAGFPLSTAYRQLRFESDHVNRGVARDLAAVRSRRDAKVRGEIARFLDGLASDLDAHASALDELDALRAGVIDVGVDDASPLPTFCELVIEDFEAPTLADSLLGPWELEGDAFRATPVTKADQPPWHDLSKFRGERFLNSHSGLVPPEAGSGAEPAVARDAAAGDALQGRATSAPFGIERRYLHLLTAGGDFDDTVIEVVVAGSVVASARGHKNKDYRHVALDLGEWRGQEARIVLRDGRGGGWGHVGLDHLVLSDRSDAGALDRARRASEWRVDLTLAQLAAARTSDGSAPGDAAHLLQLEELLRRGAERGDSHPAWWIQRSRRAGPSAGPNLEGAAVERLPGDEVPPAPKLVLDYADEDTAWHTNGPTFGAGPVESGDVVYASGVRPRVVALPSAAADPFWNLLETDGTSERHEGDLRYVQAGRTVVSPSFRLEGGHLFHLVRGRGHVFAACDSHRMLAGPLWTESKKRFDTGGPWRWVHHDLTRLDGAMVRLEFTADEGALDLEVAACAMSEERRAPRLPFDGGSLAEEVLVAIDELEPDASVTRAVVAIGAQRLRDAARFVELGGLPGRALDDAERGVLAATADAAIEDAASVLGIEDLQGALAAATDELEALAQRAIPVSSIAPASLELEGRDEFVLRRGDPRSPMQPAPRRDLAAVRADDEPLATRGGSGRLALADSWLDGEHPLVARVWTNRLWHHVFGRGIVSTVDDLGATGAAPTHPELLDRLARDLVDGGWSTKGMLRRLVLSDAFRRSSQPADDVRAQLDAHDPENTLLARMNVRRLEAEAVRDALLAVSGELNEERFGPPVPVHLTPFMQGRGRPGSGPLDGRGRRSIYLSVRRNFLAPLLTVFDFPTPSGTRGARSVSNVPAQALALANDPFVVQRAEATAARILHRNIAPDDRVPTLFRLALGRDPLPAEADAAQSFVQGAEGPVKGFTDLAHALFGLQEFLWIR